jgi:hypothetical protein
MYCSMLVLLLPWHELNEIKTNGQTFQEALDIFKGTAGPSIHRTMENIMNVQIMQLDTETPIINSGHPTLWASAPKQWLPRGMHRKNPRHRVGGGGRSTKAYQNFLTSKKCGGTRYFRHFWAILGHFYN